MRPSGDFNYESSKSKLANLRLDSDEGPRITLTIPGDVIGADRYEMHDENSGRHEHLLRLAGWVDVESRVTVCQCTSEGCQRRVNNKGWLCRCCHLVSTKTTSYTIFARRFFSSWLLLYLCLGDVLIERNYVRFALLVVVFELINQVRQCRHAAVTADYWN